MMVRQRMLGRKKKDAPSAPASVTVVSSLTAEWPIEAETAEQVLIVGHELQEKIKEADLAGLKETENLSPEEAEILEEMEDVSMGFSSGEEKKPGEPVFLYVRSITDQELADARADAFATAKQAAAQLAHAAGATLGPLRALNDHSAGPNLNSYNELYSLMPSTYYAMQQYSQRPGRSDKTEAVGPLPGKVTYSIAVSASFALETAAGKPAQP
jgi:hypothetical protein